MSGARKKAMRVVIVGWNGQSATILLRWGDAVAAARMALLGG